MIRGKEKYFTDPRKSTGTLIVLLVKYEAIGILVLEKRFDHAALEDMEPVYNDDEQDVFRVVVGKATVERLQYHVSQLDAVNRGLFQMKHMRNKTDGEIADEIGLSKNAVAIRLHKIRKKLLEKMREEGYVDE
jgi:DNA-directed RNA polymerase specialized sigma24 family protein